MAVDNVDELADAAYSAVYDQYEERGRRVRIMLYPFSSWFWTPWIIFSFITLIKPHTLLTPWTYKREQSKVLLQARYFYMAYVIMKFVQLLTQNLCALQVNSYHKTYYRSMKKRLTTWYNTCRGDKQLYKTVACQKTFEFNEENLQSDLVWCGPRSITSDSSVHPLSFLWCVHHCK